MASATSGPGTSVWHTLDHFILKHLYLFKSLSWYIFILHIWNCATLRCTSIHLKKLSQYVSALSIIRRIHKIFKKNKKSSISRIHNLFSRSTNIPPNSTSASLVLPKIRPYCFPCILAVSGGQIYPPEGLHSSYCSEEFNPSLIRQILRGKYPSPFDIKRVTLLF